MSSDDPGVGRDRRARRHPHRSRRADAQGRRADRYRSIYRQEVRPFTDKQIELLTSFAAQAVIAIENTRLLNELRTNPCSSRPRPRTCSRSSAARLRLQPVFDTLRRERARLCEASSAHLAAHDGDAFALARRTASRPHHVEAGERKLAIRLTRTQSRPSRCSISRRSTSPICRRSRLRTQPGSCASRSGRSRPMLACRCSRKTS